MVPLTKNWIYSCVKPLKISIWMRDTWHPVKPNKHSYQYIPTDRSKGSDQKATKLGEKPKQKVNLWFAVKNILLLSQQQLHYQEVIYFESLLLLLMAAFNTLLSFNTHHVRRLLQYKVGNDEEHWSEKAVKSLVRKLKKTGGLEELEKSISSGGILIIYCYAGWTFAVYLATGQHSHLSIF